MLASTIYIKHEDVIEASYLERHRKVITTGLAVWDFDKEKNKVILVGYLNIAVDFEFVQLAGSILLGDKVLGFIGKTKDNQLVNFIYWV